MILRNFLKTPPVAMNAQGGKGDIRSVFLYTQADFETPLRFIIYSELSPGQSIGLHQHGQDEEVYVILEGHGHMTVNGQPCPVEAGDVLLNKPGWSHSLENTSQVTLRLLVFEVGKPT
jgi:mannose-6-phosphate isomerase-like protein (cupin superfamily)